MKLNEMNCTGMQEMNELEQVCGGDRFDVYSLFKQKTDNWNKGILCDDRYVLDAAMRDIDEIDSRPLKNDFLKILNIAWNNGEPLPDFPRGEQVRNEYLKNHTL